MTVTLDKSHELKGNGYLLGVGGENESEQLIINIAYDVLLDKWAYIEFEQIGVKFTTERLTIENGQIVYTLKNSVLVQGHINIQVVFRDANGFNWKSFKRQFAVSEEINATESLPEQHPDFITEAQRLLDEVSVESDKVDAVLITEEARVAAEAQRAENEATREENELARGKAELVRITEETARKTAENERQINEAGRVDAETARRTEFSGWADSLGNLNTYDKRLINLEEAGVGTLFDYVTDDSTAYSKTVPAKALPYARLTKVSDAVTSVKSIGKNLFDFDKLSSVAGAAINREHKTITIEAGNNNRYVGKVADIMPSMVVGKTYYLKAVDTNAEARHIVYFNPAGVIVNFGASFVCTQEILNSEIAFYNGASATEANTISRIMVSASATEYEPYKAITYAIPLTDNYIKVEANGTIVFENDAAVAVPSEIIYAVKR